MIPYQQKIKKLQIQNFRIFDKIDVDLASTHYYALVGKNGLGKTALLEAINICLSENSSKFNTITEDDFRTENDIIINIEFDEYFFLAYDISGFERLFPCKGISKTIKHRQRSSGDLFSSPFIIETAYNFVEYPRLTAKQYEDKFGKHLDLIGKKQQIVWSLETKTANAVFSIKTNQLENVISIMQISSGQKVLFPKVFYFDKNRERELLPKYNTTFSNITKELNWKFKNGLSKQSNEEIKNQYRQLFEDIHINVREVEALKDKLLAPTIKLFKEEFKLEYDIDDLNFYYYDRELPYANALFGHKSSENKIIKILQTGSGIAILTALGLLVSLSEHSETPIIILIDEPELHLHADLQKMLFKYLSAKKFTCIIATHSHLFLDKTTFFNNLQFLTDSRGKVKVDGCNQISLASTIYDLLGNSLDDLYVPEKLILVEGKYDKAILEKILLLVDKEKKGLLITSCGGYTEIPEKGEVLEKYFESHINADRWYAKYISNGFKVIVDGDVSKEKVAVWRKKFNLSEERVYHLPEKSMEYLFPESLVKELVAEKSLKNDKVFSELTKEQIIDTILKDDKTKEEKWIQRKEERISKQRLNEYIGNNITLKILKTEEAAELKKIADWIIS